VSALVKRLSQYAVRIEAVGIDQGEAGALDHCSYFGIGKVALPMHMRFSPAPQ
jgi:hypothetical protein